MENIQEILTQKIGVLSWKAGLNQKQQMMEACMNYRDCMNLLSYLKLTLNMASALFRLDLKMRATSPNSFRGRSNIRSKTLREAFPPAYLFMYFGPAFDLRHNHSHDASSEGGSEGEELLVGGDVLIP